MLEAFWASSKSNGTSFPGMEEKPGLPGFGVVMVAKTAWSL